ncbi:contactin-5-like [Hetaerina americana]|uniref:contactin-5-like n=1 Tax=Hetaerina americana TaxID=62018 RepID=UPI003A7F2A0C
MPPPIAASCLLFALAGAQGWPAEPTTPAAGFFGSGPTRWESPFVGRPQVFHLRVGQYMGFLCNTRAPPRLNSQWRKNGVPVPALAPASGEPTSEGPRLIIRWVSLRDSGQYTCGGDGPDAAAALIFVHPSPRERPLDVRVTPTSVNVVEGMPVDIQCSADGYPQPIVIVWHLKERPFSSRVTIEGNRLQVHSAMASDSGTYVCVASNREGFYTEAISNVVVSEQKPDGELMEENPGLIKVLPEEYHGPVGLKVVLWCITAAGVNSAVEWKRINGHLPSTARYTMGKQKMEIMNAQVNDSGVYSCHTWHERGKLFLQAFSKVSILPGDESVKTDPNLIQVLPKEFQGIPGSTVTLSCAAVIGGDSAVVWRRQSGTIPSKATYTKGNQQLILINAQPSDSGVYFCATLHESGKYYIRAFSEVTIKQSTDNMQYLQRI